MPTLSIRTVGEATLVVFSDQPDCFRICAVADANYWEASFDLADVVRQFPTKNCPESADYMSDLVAAFDDQTNQTVSLALSTVGPEARVTWSQSLADGLKVIRGEFCLKKAGSLEVGVRQILSLCKNCLSSQRQEISNLRKENTELRSVAKTAVQQYSDVVVEASRKEEHLYAVFAALLNTKKAKIRALEEASSPTTAKKKKEADSPPSTMEVDSPPEAPKAEDGDFASVPQLSTKGLAEKLSKNSPRKPRTTRAKKPLPPAVIGEDISLDDLA